MHNMHALWDVSECMFAILHTVHSGNSGAVEVLFGGGGTNIICMRSMREKFGVMPTF